MKALKELEKLKEIYKETNASDEQVLKKAEAALKNIDEEGLKNLDELLDKV